MKYTKFDALFVLIMCLFCLTSVVLILEVDPIIYFSIKYSLMLVFLLVIVTLGVVITKRNKGIEVAKLNKYHFSIILILVVVSDLTVYYDHVSDSARVLYLVVAGSCLLALFAALTIMFVVEKNINKRKNSKNIDETL